MLDINSIIGTFNPEQQLQFIRFLEQKNKRKDTKNIQLFKLISQGKLDSKTICLKLYKSENSNAYHALRQRLFKSLIDFTANRNLEDENSIDIQIIKYILAARTFLTQKNYTIAYKVLDKAEQLATEHFLYPILNEIYHTKIQYAPNYPSLNLNLTIQKQQENQKKHILEEQLNIIYAKLKIVLHEATYNGKVINFEDELNSLFNSNNITLNESLSFKSLYQILTIVNISALVSNTYYKIEDFVLKSYNVLNNKKDDKQLFYKIHIVYIIANTLFRNKKFEKSLYFINEMKTLMKQKNNRYFNSFILKNTLVEALNLNYNGKPKEAITITEHILKKKYNDKESVLDLKLSLFMFYFQQRKFKDAKSITSKLYHSDNYYIKQAGIDWVIKKNLAELLLFIELEDDDLFQSRVNSFKKRYYPYIREIKKHRIITFISITEQIQKTPSIIKNPDFKEKIKASFEFTSAEKEDIFVMSFFAWLKSKISNSELYNTTLTIISNNK